jgi:predicted dehydrogenase/threonine dehydrogenase-like Zn-dependent dehydrogenase
MRQVIQNLRNGQTEILSVPGLGIETGAYLLKSAVTLVSAGTERMLVDFGKSGYLGKARSQPEKVRQVFDKIRTDGLMTTLHAVQAKLDQPIPLGYCNVGVVVEAGQGGGNGAGEIVFKPGDRVLSNGPHAEYVSVSPNLCAKVPDGVSDEEAAFGIIGAIGLQGIRLVQPTLGECFVVTGLGLVGLLTVQLLKAQGCRVLGIDMDGAKCELAEAFGAEAVNLSAGEDPVEAAAVFSAGRGVDGVLITAATKSSEPVLQAARMCRKRGRIVLVGVTGLELNRSDFYEKELSFQVSCSYGPGRYDPLYEQKGQDYPLPYVRWTARRNFEAVLQLMAEGKLDVKPLITHRFPIEEAEKAYALLAGGQEPYLGILLTYGSGDEGRPASGLERTIFLPRAKTTVTGEGIPRPRVGVIGAGNFTGQVLLPALKASGAGLRTIVSKGGVNGTHFGRKFGFEQSSTDVQSVFNDPETHAVFVTTRHNSHAGFAVKALQSGKAVYVEKPLCLTAEQLQEIIEVHEARAESSSGGPILMVGFNRRFAPHAVRMKQLLSAVREPKTFVVTVNAGFIPPDHWTQDPEVGGGRLIGEACHFIDLLRFLAGRPISTSQVQLMKDRSGDTFSITLGFEDGSLGTIHYFANGSRAFPKERVEVFCSGRVLQLDNFRSLKGFGWPGFSKMKLWRQDKGHAAGVAAFVDALRKGTGSPIPFEEIVEVTSHTLKLSGMARGESKD